MFGGNFHEITPSYALNPDIPRDLECITAKPLSHCSADRSTDGTAPTESLTLFLVGEPAEALSI